MESIRKYYRADRKDISFIKFIVEACEGLAVLSTEDSQMGILKFLIAPGCEEEFEDVIRGLKGEIRIESWHQDRKEKDKKMTKVRG